MSEFSSVSGIHDDFQRLAVTADFARDRSDRRVWIAPALFPHSTMTELTQSPLRQPLSLLFLQSSVQCFNHLGNPVPCP